VRDPVHAFHPARDPVHAFHPVRDPINALHTAHDSINAFHPAHGMFSLSIIYSILPHCAMFLCNAAFNTKNDSILCSEIYYCTAKKPSPKDI